MMRERLVSIARRTLPAPACRWLRKRFGRPEGLASVFSQPSRLFPVSREWGYDRGGPIDRYYVETFLQGHASDVRGRVLEICDDAYTQRFGGDRIESSDVLDVNRDNPRATIVADLARADQVPSGRFDCIILTQTLQFIYETRAVIETLYRILKPGGVLLATFPGITKISWSELPGSWYWGFTCNSARRLFGEVFSPADVAIESYGNVLTASAFLYGFSHRELSRKELDYRDPEFDLLVAVRAVKSLEES